MFSAIDANAVEWMKEKHHQQVLVDQRPQKYGNDCVDLSQVIQILTERKVVTEPPQLYNFSNRAGFGGGLRGIQARYSGVESDDSSLANRDILSHRLNNKKEKSMEDTQTASGEKTELKALIDVSIEGWRFARVFGRLITKLDAGDAPRYANQARYFLKKIDDGLEEFGLHIVSLEGQPYDPGMAVSALNIADFGPDDILVVDQMVEPVIMGPEGLVRGGTAMLVKVNQQ